MIRVPRFRQALRESEAVIIVDPSGRKRTRSRLQPTVSERVSHARLLRCRKLPPTP